MKSLDEWNKVMCALAKYAEYSNIDGNKTGKKSLLNTSKEVREKLNRVFRRFVNFKSILLFHSITRYLVDGGRIWTLIESLIAFLTVLTVSSVIYLLGRLKAPKSSRNREKVSMYACGERARSGRLTINITLYKYLVYFMILDSSVLFLAFASLAINPGSILPLIIYLFAILTAMLLLAVGGD